MQIFVPISFSKMALKSVCTLFLILQVLQHGKAQDATLDTTGDWNGTWFSPPKSQEACFYSHQATDLYYAWGCGGPQTTTPNDGVGYWTACKVPFCKVLFYKDGFNPDSIQVKATVSGEAVISILVKTSLETTAAYSVFNLTSGDTGLFQGEVNIDLSGFHETVKNLSFNKLKY